MLLDLNFRVIGETLPDFWLGFLATLSISLTAFAGALVIGVIACAMSIQPSRLLRAPAVAYVDVIRATPLLAQLYFLYFGLPSFGILMPEVVIGIIALSLNSGAYVSEIIRSGIMSIPRGQVEASASSGMSYWQQMRLIILPQALRPMVSPLIGQAIVLVKDSSLLSLISVLELTRAGQTLANDRFMPVEGLAATAVGYLIIYFGLKLMAAAWMRINQISARH
ncbi:MAG: amino acid ABC transporter permease [Gammaproteobacteria bacterium]|uniref:amino acid ABC transporter permease n=1 Tax=Rhodoferax sp. TaxID=50421 RepID=UPI0018248469|nr:amino acid ABC transporter permease [Rhodoferax sp.]MBU3898878.1 amino acid ABC transporter permease [Gammaproteobacteria bacterium]MBA3059499.1 amino acid ABC transporter permease [Rhodoferax sp.]MBU3999069.1 amino acid ABC transporter permease [Gammaproteobacteria bacterium]MBU4019354.1 amino acid ABC transporter permease [Gammaproteobacteria bacterium]MBU4081918.1 amino acid ABC transporter permease [Gammaproteobacteria bacterium]